MCASSHAYGTGTGVVCVSVTDGGSLVTMSTAPLCRANAAAVAESISDNNIRAAHRITPPEAMALLPEKFAISNALQDDVSHFRFPFVLLFVAVSRRIDAAGAVSRRAAPNALVRAGAVPVYLVGGVYAAMAVACATAPLAVLLVVAMLVDLIWTVYAAMAVARAAAMPTFACH